MKGYMRRRESEGMHEEGMESEGVHEEEWRVKGCTRRGGE